MNHVFYKGVLHYQYDPADWTKGRVHTNEEIPAFCWIFNDEQPGWFYMENPRFSTHVPTEHVPAELRALALLLT